MYGEGARLRSRIVANGNGRNARCPAVSSVVETFARVIEWRACFRRVERDRLGFGELGVRALSGR
jgi:hypothetical protein